MERSNDNTKIYYRNESKHSKYKHINFLVISQKDFEIKSNRTLISF